MSNKTHRLKRDVFIPWEMIENEAFKKLGASALRTLIRFLQKRRWEKSGKSKKPTYINDPQPLTQAEAKRLGIGTTQHTENIKKLIELGFIDLDHQGGAYGQDYSRYLLSERWRYYGTDKFQKVIKPKVCRKGNDIQSNMQKKQGLGSGDVGQVIPLSRETKECSGGSLG